jgi:hypothetical protein
MAIEVLRCMPIGYFKKELSRISLIHTIYSDLDKYNIPTAEKKKKILQDSYIIYLMASWQTFIVDTALEAFNALIISDQNTIFHERLRKDLEACIKRFNNPSTQNIDELIEIATGVKKISNCWQWQDVTCESAKNKLNEIWKIRCEIAHSGKTEKLVSEKINTDYTGFLFNMGYTMNNELAIYITEKTGIVVFRKEQLR